MQWIDTHAHLGYFPENELSKILERAIASHVNRIINIATSIDDLKRGLEISSEYPWISLASAVTPHDVIDKTPYDLDLLARYVEDGKLIAIGECGLDYYYGNESRAEQIALFERQIELAVKYNLPLLIHARDAFSDLFSLADRVDFPKKTLIHCFTGSQAEAEEIIHRGWFLSFSGIITFPKSLELQKIAEKISLDHVVIETDAPYLAPEPYRGKRNEPAYLIEVAKMLSKLKNMTLEELSLSLEKSSRDFFQ